MGVLPESVTQSCFSLQSGQVGELAFAGCWWSMLVWIAIPTWLMEVTLPRPRWRYRAAKMSAIVFLTVVGARPRVAQQRTLPEGTLTRMPGLLAFRLGAIQVADVRLRDRSRAVELENCGEPALAGMIWKSVSQANELA